MTFPSMTAMKCRNCSADAQPPVTVMGLTVNFPYCIACAHEACVEAEVDEAQQEIGLRLDRAGITKRLSVFTWGEATRPEVGRDWLDAYLSGVRRNLILGGSVGAGKTGLVALIVRELTERGTAALFLNFRDLLWDIKLSYGIDDRDAASHLALRAQSVPILALDDLGAERPTPWACEELATLVDRRYERKLPTIVTSNFSPSELAGRFSKENDSTVGRRIVSRLVENAQIVKFDNDDRRLA